MQNLLHMMGSELKVDSVYGEGSVFSFELVQQVMSNREIGDYRQSFQKLIGRKTKQQYVYAPDARILVVDDNAVNLRVTRNLLKRNGVQIDTAASGMECIELARKTKYNIIFLDHMMPQMDGIETFARLREEKLLPGDTAVIMMTANEIMGAREEYLRQGFTDYISKPIAVKQLEEMLSKHLPPDMVSYREVRKTAAAEGAEQPTGGSAKQDSQKQSEDPIEQGSQKQAEDLTERAPQEQAEDSAEQAPQEQTENLTERKSEAQEAASSDGPIPGIDMSVGLTYCAEDEEFYREMLEEYVADNTADELDGYRSTEDWNNYLVKVHALKSASRTIGATMLGDQAFGLETATREGNYEFVEDHHEKLMQDYRQLLAKIQTYLNERE